MKRLKQKFLLYGMIGLIGTILLGFVFSFLVFAWYAKDLPSPGKLAQTTDFSTVFYDRNGKVLYDMYKDKNRVPIPYSEIPAYLRQATVAIEDKNFYKHGAISETGIIRSFLNIIFRQKIEGGSTITQQLIKNVILADNRRTASRKIKEMILAFEVEGKYSKDQILGMYLNEAPYGGNYYGVGTASRGYFNKEPKELTLVESAILAGLPQDPTNYSPYLGKNDAWRGRAKDVLRRMREDGYIKSDQEKTALTTLSRYKFSAQKLAINAPHFVFYVRDLLDKEYGTKIIEQGVKIKTTLDLETQKIAETVVYDEIKNLKDLNVTNGGVLVLDSQTGEILAMVGSYDFNDDKYGKFNVVTQALRQPGSTVKPINYAVAFEKGYTPATVLMDVKTSFPDGQNKTYDPVNYDGKFRGPMQVRFALGNSENIPAVKMLAMVGVKDFMQKAYDMGLDTFQPTDENMKRFGLAITLGGGETTLYNLTSAFSVFAAGGIKREPSPVLEINDFNGKSIFKSVRSKEKQVVSPEISFLVSHILSDNNARLEAFGPNSYLNVPGKTVAVKTGTTNDKRDNWTIGYTKNITVGVWVGNNDNSVMNPKIASGVTGASSIWYKIMTQLLKKYKDGILDKPDSVKAVTIDAFLGGLPKDGNPTRSEYFINGTEPKDISPFYKKLKISKANGKLANDVEIKTGAYDEKDFIVLTENDPVSADGKNRWQEGINAWANEQSDAKFKPPTEISDNSADNVVVQIKDPQDKSQVSSTFTIKGKVTTMSPIKTIKIYINGEEVKKIDGDHRDFEESFTKPDGVYEVKAMAWNDKDKTGDSTIKIGVNKAWDSPP